MEDVTLYDLLNLKLSRLTWTEKIHESKILSEEGFSVEIDYYKNIGKNKDKDQLLVNINYKDINIGAFGSIDNEESDYFAKWFIDIAEIIDKSDELHEKFLETEGRDKFKNLYNNKHYFYLKLIYFLQHDFVLS